MPASQVNRAAPGQSNRKFLGWAAVLLLLFLVFSLFIGRYPGLLLTPGQLMEDELAQRLVLNLRMPRLLTAMLLGMSLSAAGAVFQMIFGNPLVEPGFLGVSQGAAFGAALSILFFNSSAWLVQSSAILFAVLGLTLSYFIARRVRFGGWVLRLVLSGIAVSALFSAGLGVLKYLADPLSQLPEITFWLLGGISGSTWRSLQSILPLVLVGLLVMYRMRWRLNLLSLEDEVASSLGVAVERERTVLLLAAVAAAAAVISVSGMVSWVGLIVPHLARRLFGTSGQYSLPAAMLMGGFFTVICDNLARSLLPGEIPLGILTSFLGAASFIFLMVSRQIKVQR